MECNIGKARTQTCLHRFAWLMQLNGSLLKRTKHVAFSEVPSWAGAPLCSQTVFVCPKAMGAVLHANFLLCCLVQDNEGSVSLRTNKQKSAAHLLTLFLTRSSFNFFHNSIITNSLLGRFGPADCSLAISCKQATLIAPYLSLSVLMLATLFLLCRANIASASALL